MSELTPEGYQRTKEKLQELERRLLAIEHRTDLPESRKADVRHSYHAMLRQYEREIKLYEATHPIGRT